jgi:hypothetical protein
MTGMKLHPITSFMLKRTGWRVKPTLSNFYPDSMGEVSEWMSNLCCLDLSAWLPSSFSWQGAVDAYRAAPAGTVSSSDVARRDLDATGDAIRRGPVHTRINFSVRSVDGAGRRSLAVVPTPVNLRQ